MVVILKCNIWSGDSMTLNEMKYDWRQSTGNITDNSEQKYGAQKGSLWYSTINSFPLRNISLKR